MEFGPANPIVKICIQGMAMEAKSLPIEAVGLFEQAWAEATLDFEKFITAYFLARHQNDTSSELKWLNIALSFAMVIHDDSVICALPDLYERIARCQEVLGDHEGANMNHGAAKLVHTAPLATGPFFHGTKADLKTGDFLNPGGMSNYIADVQMNHIYFTALLSGAGLAASMAKGEGTERVYIVEPTGKFENDPNLTNKKFPGNMTRSYRSDRPLKIIGEVKDWNKMGPEELQQLRDRLSDQSGKIIN